MRGKLWLAILFFAASVIVATVGPVGCSSRENAQPSAETPLFQSGMYSWDEISRYLPDVQKMRTHIVRIAGKNVLNDELWATLLGANFDVLYCVGEVADRSMYRSDADYVAAYLASLDAILSRYGPGGTFWQSGGQETYRPLEQVSILNEPNSYGTGTLEQKAVLYGQLLVAAYAHIKSKWPTVTIVGFEVSDASAAAPDFISQVFSNNKSAANAFDVMGIHPYTKGYAPDGLIVEDWGNWTLADNIKSIRQVLHDYRVDYKPIWITETGFKISNADGGRYTDSVGTVSPEMQAAYNIRTDLLAVANGIPRVYHMFVTDTDDRNYGFFQSVGNPRPVAVATATMNKYLRDATKFEIIEDGSSNIFYYRFTTPRGQVGVAWATAPADSMLKLAGSTTEIVDMFDHSVATTKASSYLLHLTGSPTFLLEST